MCSLQIDTKNHLFQCNNLQSGEIINEEIFETSNVKSLSKRKSFPYDVFSSSFSGPRKAPPPTLKVIKKRLQVITNNEKVMQEETKDTNTKLKNIKVDRFLPKINPLVLLKYNSANNLTRTQRSHLYLKSHNGMFSPNYPESTRQFSYQNPISNNVKRVKLGSLVKYNVVEDKIKKSLNNLSPKINPFLQKLKLLKGTKRLKYGKDKITKVEILDKIEEDTEPIINVTFGK